MRENKGFHLVLVTILLWPMFIVLYYCFPNRGFQFSSISIYCVNRRVLCNFLLFQAWSSVWTNRCLKTFKIWTGDFDNFYSIKERKSHFYNWSTYISFVNYMVKVLHYVSVMVKSLALRLNCSHPYFKSTRDMMTEIENVKIILVQCSTYTIVLIISVLYVISLFTIKVTKKNP